MHEYSMKVKCVESSVGVHGLSGGVEESKLLSRRHFRILQGEHDRNYQRSKNQSSENDDTYAFYEAHTHATFKCRGITNPKTMTAMHFTRSTSLLL